MRQQFFYVLSFIAMALVLPLNLKAEDEVTNYFTNLAKHPLSDTDMVLTGDGWSDCGDYIRQYIEGGSNATLTTTITVSQKSYVAYGWYTSGGCDMHLYVDDVLVNTITGAQIESYYGYGKFFYWPLTPGTHKVTWEFANVESSKKHADFKGIGLIKAPEISVSLLEAGSLGTEVLYQVDHLQEVRNLKISGKMNSDDWDKLYMMTNILSLDLSEADMTSLPDEAFGKYINSYYSPKLNYLCELKFPNNLTSIGKGALAGTAIEDVNIPSTVTTIGESAFFASRIRNADLSNINDIADGLCYSCRLLENIVFSDQLHSVGESSFSGCSNTKAKTIKFPPTLTSIGSFAFNGCENLNFRFPDIKMSLSRDAFDNTAIDSLIIKKTWETDDRNILFFVGDLPKCVYIEFPVDVIDCGIGYIGNDRYSLLNKIKLNSPTVTLHGGSGFSLENVTIVVPSFLVNSYKLDNYWYNAKSIEGFDTNKISYWEINNPLVLNASDRFLGTPDVTIAGNKSRMPSLKVNGDASMTLNNLFFDGYYYKYNYSGQIISNCNNITINGLVGNRFYTERNTWYFLSLPYDAAVEDIKPQTAGAQFAIRYYDGANRAENGATGSWKNFEDDAVITAGTGFIFQTSADTWTEFWSQENGSRQNAVSNNDFVKSLDLNDSYEAANKGWNLVGNPWQCYYNNHKINFTAPITVWDTSSRTYSAYSLSDDDYAIRPNEAFFVQCPGEEVQSISFPTTGRQLSDVIESQNAAPARSAQSMNSRQLIDVEVRNADFSGKTRVVVNEDATLGYDMNCDASKFMSADSDAPQLYTLDAGGTEYAINERPQGDGHVQLGFYTKNSGAFTISMPRCDARKVLLVDAVDNVTVDLTAQEYGFTTAAGRNDTRFTLVIESDDATDIASLESRQMTAKATEGGIDIRGVSGVANVFTVDGRLVASQNVESAATIPVPKGMYIVRMASKSVKVMVK